MSQETYDVVKKLKKENRALRKYIRSEMKGDARFFAEKFLKSLRTRDTAEREAK